MFFPFRLDIYYNSLRRYCVDKMKKVGLNLRITQNRLNKLRLYAVENEKTMTQVISDFIDNLSIKAVDKRLEVDKLVER